MTKPFKDQNDIIPSSFSLPPPQHHLNLTQDKQAAVNTRMITMMETDYQYQCEYRIRIHPHQMTCVTEQSVHHLLTNIQISNMNNFCMFLQINSEDRIHKEFKLYTQCFIYPSYSGKLYVKVKNLCSFTKVLHP